MEQQNSFLLLFTSGEIYGIWNDYHEGKVYVSFDYDKSTPFMFSMTLKDHQPNTMMFNAMSQYSFWRNFLNNFKSGLVYFENQRVKYNMYQLIKMYYNK